MLEESRGYGMQRLFLLILNALIIFLLPDCFIYKYIACGFIFQTYTSIIANRHQSHARAGSPILD